MGGKVFKRGVVYSIAVAIATFVPQSKNFITNVFEV